MRKKGKELRIAKPKHQYMLKDPSPSETTIESMRNWIRKIEQTTQSISSRLAAVEKRFSTKTIESSENEPLATRFEQSLKQLSTHLKTPQKQKQFRELSHVLTQEFLCIKEILDAQNQEIATVKEQLAVFNQLINEAAEKPQTMLQEDQNRVEEIIHRLQLLENRIPRVLKLGTVEIPIEITGIIGGILAFVIALLIGLQYNEIVFSPWFLVIIGFVLLASALIKTVPVGSAVFKPWKTKRLQTCESVEK